MQREKKKGKLNRRKGFRSLPAVVLFLLLMILWQAGADRVNIPHIFPGPLAILKRTWELRRTLLLHHLPVTMETILLGWGLSTGVGVGLAVLMDLSPKCRAAIYPALVVTQTIPVMCITPLFVLWFGYTIWARLLSVVLSTFFSITLNTVDGFNSVDREKEELMRSFHAGRWQIFRHLKVPTAFPKFVTALKMTFPWAVIDAAVAEWLGATRGLGYFSKRMITRMDGPAVFAAVLILCVISLAGMALLNLLDQKAAGYRKEI